MSQIQVLNLQSLDRGLPAITPAFGAALAEAGAICLTDEDHQRGVTLEVEGEFSTTFILDWQPVTEQARRCWNDQEYATEQAAYAVAFLLILQLTNLTVIERSRKGTGFDYWLGIQDSTATLPFQRMARLEVSGIRQGNRSQINARVKQKIEQTRASDAQGLPAYIIVVEFSHPISVISAKHNPEGARAQ
ncbi:hypothetical protein IQ270_03695 [Microcoleus sp. LEGE 07076]|uniref:hypothetical protein n=1 Tax=Microcoleus sp. LEGE 07076 TaxID=915322 RepID=UPI0018802EBC|nr:hypothetical protein [Microcoleus sp. LEGE 07076]MBE9183850.1 hypothetical protein [Microcoleus sp. LEGE 07076]